MDNNNSPKPEEQPAIGPSAAMGVMTAREYLATVQSLEKSPASTEKPSADTSAKTGSSEAEDNHIPNGNSEESKKTGFAVSESTPPPAKKLSDMEVMEHTASVWNYREITDDGTEIHTEFHEKQSGSGNAEIIAARVRGKKHKHEGTNCDDYFETACSEDFVAAVVCDGAGSKKLSRIGSRVSSEAAVKFLKEELGRLFEDKAQIKMGLCAELNSPEFMSAASKVAAVVRQSAEIAFKAQQNRLAEISEDESYINALGRQPIISDMYTTFLAVVAVPLVTAKSRQVFAASVQIGDGCICAIDSSADSSRNIKLLGEADSGAFSGETDFLSEKNIRPEVIAGKTRVSRGTSDIIMLMSDGVADDYFPGIPMLGRLYLDLCLNGILPMSGELTAGEDPAPIRFKSVSMSRQSVALQYAKQLLSDNSEEAMNALWDKREALRCHSLEAFRMNIGDTPVERLRVWLDNYNERGSFDDRTLAVIRLKDNPDIE